MTYVDAAVTVLATAGRPLTVKEIADEAVRRGLIVPGGATPRKSMDAALALAAKRRDARVRRVEMPGEPRGVGWVTR